MNVKDINCDRVFKTTRSTNPLNPRYRYDVPDFKKFTKQSTQKDWLIGEIEGSSPSKLPKLRNDKPLFSLRTDDIPNMKNFHEHSLPPTFPPSKKRRNWRKINDTTDIDGCKPSGKYSTFKIKSKRITNPLDPTY